ncbi:hypothetical protein BVG19_g1866 [[Candida] boidinii]|nr:hypothetical protein BVG19_g1866 [[Candida] boidinii]OWB51450.1 hypothetical protein B5S27_g3011 [[Candida] boidinii]
MSASNIWIAASDGNLKLVTEYIESGSSSANAKDPNGYTPIHAAVSYGHIELLRYLISKGGDINIQDVDGDTPLHHAETVDVAKILINEFNANYKLKNNEGLTPAKYQEEEDEFPELIEFLNKVENYGVESVNNNNNSNNNNKDKESSSQDNKHDVDDGLTLPNGEKFTFKLEKDVSGNGEEGGDEEMKNRRLKLQEIMANGADDEATDEKLRDFVMSAVHKHVDELRDDDENDNSKRRK